MKMEPNFDDAEQMAQLREIRSRLHDWYMPDSTEGFCWSMDREGIIDPITRRSVGSRLVITLERHHAPISADRKERPNAADASPDTSPHVRDTGITADAAGHH